MCYLYGRFQSERSSEAFALFTSFPRRLHSPVASTGQWSFTGDEERSLSLSLVVARDVSHVSSDVRREQHQSGRISPFPFLVEQQSSKRRWSSWCEFDGLRLIVRVQRRTERYIFLFVGINEHTLTRASPLLFVNVLPGSALWFPSSLLMIFFRREKRSLYSGE